jgi:hypothetical protein
MNKQELFKQADYTFQRGNRELAKKYLTEYLSAYPNDEAAWMLMARIVEEKERKIDCYQRVTKINPNNNEAKIALVRVNSVSPTLPLPKKQNTTPWQAQPNQHKNRFRGILVGVFIFLLFGATTLVMARNNPQSKFAQFLAIATPTITANSSLTNDIAPRTRAEVSESYPQYAPLVDALIGFAIENADTGMEGAPERPGSEIMVSEQAGIEAKTIVENALPQPGSLSSITITEQQVTSWLVMEMQQTPDLPLKDVQVYLRNGKVQVWAMVNGSVDSTSALIVGEIKIDNNQQPYFVIESMQIGTQVVPNFLLGQMESWVNEMVVESINEQLPGLALMNVNVVNGLVTVSGMR